MTLKLISQSAQTFDLESAQHWLDTVHYQYQRPLSKKYVRFYASEMRKGNWVNNNPIVVAHYDNKQILVNGQHTLSAIVESSIAQKQPMLRFECKNEADVAKLYSHIDRGKPRNYTDTLRAFRFHEQLGMSITNTERVTSSAVIINQGFSINKGVRQSNFELMALAKAWAPEMRAILRLLQGSDISIRYKVCGRPVAPVMLVAMRYQPEAASEFVYGVAHLQGLKRHDPRGALHRHLLSTKLSGGDSPFGFSPRDYWRATAHTWKRHLKNLTLARVPSPTTLERMYPQIKIEGTPWAKGAPERE